VPARQCYTEPCPENFDFSEVFVNILFGQYLIRRESADRESGKIIVQIGRASFVAQLIR